jgi:opacity protein-like surface antigen
MKSALCGVLIAIACAGAARAEAQPSGSSSNRSFELTLFNGYYIASDLYSTMGAGAKVDLSQALALRFEGRWRVTDTAISTSSGVYCDYWGYCYSYSSDWYNSGELTAGLTYKLRSH